MTKLEISDLSFCEVATEEGIEVKGGLALAGQLSEERTQSLINELLSSQVVDFSSDKIEPISSEYTVQKIQDKNNGLSGFKFNKKDGTGEVRVLTGPNSNFISASSQVS